MAKFGINYTEINIEKNPHEAKKIIKADKLDLILELSGRFDGSYGRILNDRLATVQASWIGYPHHPGFSAVDFFLTDNFCQPQNLPPDEESKIYRFDRIFSSFDASHLEKVATSCQIPRTTIASKIRFVSLNHARKLNHDVLKLWAAALRRVPNSILTFKSSSITPYQEEWIISEFAKHGIAQDRLTVVRKNDTQEEHLNYLSNVDIALDTFPYNGTTTTCDALYMGVPTITLLGDQHVSRVTSAILAAVGCNELIARNEDEFVNIAANLAEDRARLARYRTSLRENMLQSELCDSRGMAKAMQKFIEDVLYQ